MNTVAFSPKKSNSYRSSLSVMRLASVVLALVVVTACAEADDSAEEGAGDAVGNEAASGEEGSEASAESPDDGDQYYAGETIEMIVPLGPGGGTDLQARMIADHLQDHVPGNPSVQVVNYDVGDFRVGSNEYANDVEHDGLTLFMSSSSAHVGVMFDQAGVEYDYGDYVPLLGTQRGNVMLIRADTGISEAADLQGHEGELFLAEEEPSAAMLARMLSFEMLGVDVEELLGYEGAEARAIALEQGEVDLTGFSTSAYFEHGEPLVEGGQLNMLFTQGQIRDGEVVRDDVLPDAPHPGELYEQFHGEEPEGIEWRAYKLLVAAAQSIDKGLYVHDDAPQEAIDALREGLDSMLSDDDFLSEVEQTVGDYELLSGEELEAAVQEFLVDVDEEARDWAIEWTNDQYGLDLREDY